MDDLETVVSGIKKLPKLEALEVSLCLLNLLLPFSLNSEWPQVCEFRMLLINLRDRLLSDSN